MNHKARSLIMALGLAVPLVAVACSSAAPTPTAAPPAKAPAVESPAKPAAPPAKTEVSPAKPAASPAEKGDAARGKAVFDANCTGCHPGGQKGVGPDIRGKSGDVVKKQVRSGGGGMPPFSPSQVNNQQLDDVAEYVKSLK